MPGIGARMHPAILGRHAVEHGGNLIGNHHPAQREIPAGDTLGERHDVRLDPPSAEGEPPSGASEAGDHLVGDKEDLVSRADFADLREIIVRRNDDSACALNRLRNESGHGVRAFVQDRLFESSCRCGPDALARFRPFEPVGMRSRNVHKAGDARLEHFPVSLNSSRAHRGQRDAVIRVPAGDDLHFLRLSLDSPVEPDCFERALVCFDSAVGEENRVEAWISDLAQTCGKLNGGNIRRSRIARTVGQRGKLRRSCFGQFFAPEAYVDVPES